MRLKISSSDLTLSPSFSSIEIIYPIENPDVATDLNNLGLAWKSLGDYKKAVEYIQQAYTTLQEILGDQHPDTKIIKDILDGLKDKNK